MIVKSMIALIEKEIVKKLSLTLILVGAALASFLFYSIRINVENAGALVESLATSLSQASSNEQNILNIQKELGRFTKTWSETEPFEIRTTVSIDGKLIAQAGQMEPFKFFHSDFSNAGKLPSNHQELVVQSQISTTKAIVWSILTVLLFEAALFTIYWFLLKNMKRSVTSIAENNFDLGRVKAADYMAHNSKGALANLDIIVDGLKNISDDQRDGMIKAINEIRTVGEKMLATRNMSPTETTKKESTKTVRSSIEPLIDTVIQQKSLQYKSRPRMEICKEFEDREKIFIEIEPTQFSAILSNLIDNSIDALPGQGKVTIRASQTVDRVSIEITDTGTSIDPEIIPSIFSGTYKSKKLGGSGIGLSHAKEYVEAWGGSISIKPQLGQGTIVKIELPRPIEDYISTVKLKEKSQIVIIDDEELIHNTWKFKLMQNPDTKKLEVLNFYSPTEFHAWISEVGHDFGNRVYMVDYEFKDISESGIDLINKHGLALESYLVTGRSHDSTVIEKAKEFGVRQIPKSTLASLNILVAVDQENQSIGGIYG